MSGLHAELRPVPAEWLVVDDGVSRNGTFVNGQQVAGRPRLGDRDQIRVGHATLHFEIPAAATAGGTLLVEDDAPLKLTPAQRRVLVTLRRPYREGAEYARPATNQPIAAESHLAVAASRRTCGPSGGASARRAAAERQTRGAGAPRVRLRGRGPSEL